MIDTLIIGGGVIGLSLARELAGRGQAVTVIDRGRLGDEASWAGAGILPAAAAAPPDSPFQPLAALSMKLHAEWAAELLDETRIDNGYRLNGEIFTASRPEQVAELRGEMQAWRKLGLSPQELDSAALADLEPALRGTAEQFMLSAFLPGSGQIRNPRHIKALIASCQRRGVSLRPGIAAEQFCIRDDKLEGVETTNGRIAAGQVCITAGSWSARVADELGFLLSIKPIRGQIVLLRQPCAQFSRVINEGLRYLVPRDDGRVLVGATMEDVGFFKQSTAAATGDLLAMATRLMPSLGAAELERTWCGFRPGTADGLPYLGPLPGIANGYIAAGHFRSGLQLAPATARVMCQQMLGETPEVDLTPFGLDRGL